MTTERTTQRWTAEHGLLSSATLALLLAVPPLIMGCGGRGQTETEGDSLETTAGTEGTSVEPGPPPADWPRVLVLGPGSGPALYLGHEENAPAVGYLNPGVRIRLESGEVNGRMKVLVAGALATKGWVPVGRIGAYAQHRGRVEGTRAYLGPNDLVGVLGPAGEGQMRIEVRPWLGGSQFLGPFVGTFPREHLADREVEAGQAESVSEGTCHRLPAGQTVPVYDRPGGEAVANLPAMEPPLPVVVLMERGGWFGIRAGYGPYLTGFLNVPLTPCEGGLPAPEPMVPAGRDGRPYWMSQETGPLHRVAAGTQLRFHGQIIARLRTEGWARELGRQDGQVDVFVAVDDQVALRGLVPADSLTLVEGGNAAPGGSDAAAPPPAPAAHAPQEELPPELQ